MINLKALIQKDVGRKQRGMKIRAGDFFMRGRRPVEIVGRDGGAVQFVDMIDGRERNLAHKDFISLGLDRIKYTGKQSEDFLRTVWGYASAKAIPFKDRARIVRSYMKSAKSEDDEQILKSWLFALNNEMEPRK